MGSVAAQKIQVDTPQKSAQLARQNGAISIAEMSAEFIDNRSQITAQRRLQASANNSDQAKQLLATSRLPQHSQTTMQLKAMSAMMNASALQARSMAASTTFGNGTHAAAQLAQGRTEPAMQMKADEAVQLKWIDNGGKYLVWDVFVDQARWYFNKENNKMFYRRAGAGKVGEPESVEKTREEWVEDLNGEDPLAHEDASVVDPSNYTEARLKGNNENKEKKIEVAVFDHLPRAADQALFEIGNKWIEFGGDPMKEKADHECSGAEWNTVDEGADVSHDMFQPSYRGPESALDGKQSVYLAHYVGEKEPIAVMMLESRKHETVQENNEYMYLRWMVAHPTKGGGAGMLMKHALSAAAKTTSQALRVESARSAIKWYQKQGLTLFKLAAHETEELCGCGEMGAGGKFKDESGDDEGTDSV